MLLPDRLGEANLSSSGTTRVDGRLVLKIYCRERSTEPPEITGPE